MARPRLSRNGLWVRIFGKIVGKSQKSKKIAKNFGKIFQKIAENSEKIVEIFQKIVEKIIETYENFPNLSLLPINLCATLKSFLRALPNPLSKP